MGLLTNGKRTYQIITWNLINVCTCCKFSSADAHCNELDTDLCMGCLDRCEDIQDCTIRKDTDEIRPVLPNSVCHVCN